MEPIFLDDATSLWRTLIVGTLGYAAVIFLLRASGKRTLSKLNMFDFVVTIAFGSVLATLLTAKSTALAQGLLAFGLLIILQWLVTKLSVASARFSRLVKARPRILYRNGEMLEKAMQEERVTREELNEAIRSSSLGSFENVGALVLETNGSISVIQKSSLGDGSALPPDKHH